MTNSFVFSSSSVTPGHPDKLCDQISDALVDEFAAADPMSRIAAECAIAKGVLFLAVRFASNASVDISRVARQVIEDVGYRKGAFTGEKCTIMTNIDEMVLGPYPRNEAEMDETAIDAVKADHQVTLFGYACRQSPVLLPSPVWLAHLMAARLSDLRASGDIDQITPDGQVQVSIEYEDNAPRRVHSVILMAGTDGELGPPPNDLEDRIREDVILPVLKDNGQAFDQATVISVNPAGTPTYGGPMSHAGLTGRKTAIDTYGEFARNSSAALSGKDPGRIDRIGAYAARYAAKNIVAAGLADECEVQLSYTIGQSRPMSLQVLTGGKNAVPGAEITDRLAALIDFRPAAIVARFRLRDLPRERNRAFYRHLAVYGQMGREDLDAPWERTDLADALIS